MTPSTIAEASNFTMQDQIDPKELVTNLVFSLSVWKVRQQQSERKQSSVVVAGQAIAAQFRELYAQVQRRQHRKLRDRDQDRKCFINTWNSLPLKSTRVFTDGSSFGNPGPAGYGFTYKLAHQPRKYISKFIHHRASNNVAELHGIRGACNSIAAELRALPPEDRDPVYIFVDNQFAINAANGESKIRANKALVTQVQDSLETLRQITPTTLVWVPGHAGIGGNELADVLAKRGAKGTNSGHPPHIPPNKHDPHSRKRNPRSYAPPTTHIPTLPNETNNTNDRPNKRHKPAQNNTENRENNKTPTHDTQNLPNQTLRRSKRSKPAATGVDGIDFHFVQQRTRKKARNAAATSTPLTCPHGKDYDYSNTNASVDLPHNLL